MVFVIYDDAFRVIEMQAKRDREVILSVWFDQNRNPLELNYLKIAILSMKMK